MNDLSALLASRAAFGFFALALSQPALAQHAGGAHEHGVAELSVATEGAALVIELSSPLDNLVGFEHAPANAAQREALAAAEARLREGASLFRLPAAAGCVLGEVRIDGAWMGGGAASKEPSAPAAGGHDHNHASAHDHEHEHDHDHDKAHAHDSADGGGHADVMASYRFECAQPQALDAIDTQLFAVFPRLREIRAARATAGGQGATVLRPGRTVLPL
ncbi:MAG: DUF2796 domain-containing protein [Thauera sp.]